MSTVEAVEKRARGERTYAVLAIVCVTAACTVYDRVQFGGGETVVNAPAAPPPPPPTSKADAPPPPPPKTEPGRVEVKGDQIVIKDKIQFEAKSAVIQLRSSNLLDDIADAIKSHPELKKIEIQGHASADGRPEKNLKLSDDRAKSVMRALVLRGVAADRLSAKGYGITKPIADNATLEGREANRRVELHIVDPAPKADEEKTPDRVQADADGGAK